MAYKLFLRSTEVECVYCLFEQINTPPNTAQLVNFLHSASILFLESYNNRINCHGDIHVTLTIVFCRVPHTTYASPDEQSERICNMDGGNEMFQNSLNKNVPNSFITFEISRDVEE